MEASVDIDKNNNNNIIIIIIKIYIAHMMEIQLKVT